MNRIWMGVFALWSMGVSVGGVQSAAKPASPVPAASKPASQTGAKTPAQAGAKSPAKPRVAWTEHYRRSTVSFGQIVQTDGKSTFYPVGTGVVVCTDDTHAFIVTAKHVFYEPDKNYVPLELNVRFSYQEKQTFSEQLGTTLQLADAKKNSTWRSLDDDSDIAALPVAAKIIYGSADCIRLDDFATEDEVFDGATVFTFGFPNNSSILTGPNGLVRAITRSGIIAWTDPNGVLENPLVLDTNVFPGNSGGPAFKIPAGLNKFGSLVISGRVAFLGIVTSGLQATVEVGDQPLKVQMTGETTSTAGVVGVGALGLVEPAAKIRRLLTMPLAK